MRTKITYEISLKEISALIRKERDARVHQRLVAMKFVMQGLHIPEVASRMDVSQRPLRKWVHRFNAHGPAALCDGPRSGQPPKLKPKQVEKFKKRVRKGITSKDNTCSLSGKDLQRILKNEFGAEYSVSKVRFAGCGLIEAVALVRFVKQITNGLICLARSAHQRDSVMVGVCLMQIHGS